MPRLRYNLVESVSLDSNLKVGTWSMGTHTVPGRNKYKYILNHSYISLIQFRTVHSIIGVYTPINGNTLSFTGLYTAIQNYTRLHRVVHSYRGL